jgi:GNAT superfamily N-acetyltransferase
VDRLRVAALTNATGAQLAEVARVFDQYRQHYGEPAAPRQTLAWLTRCTRQGQLTIFTAYRGQDLAGLATTLAVPASLQLSCYWQLRDLYVIPGARRCGAGRALLQTVRQAAAAAGATRLSVQTEPTNTAALQLYRTSGFTLVRGVEALILPLPQDRT